MCVYVCAVVRYLRARGGWASPFLHRPHRSQIDSSSSVFVFSSHSFMHGGWLVLVGWFGGVVIVSLSATRSCSLFATPSFFRCLGCPRLWWFFGLLLIKMAAAFSSIKSNVKLAGGFVHTLV